MTLRETSEAISDSAEYTFRLLYSSHTGPYPRPFLLCRIWADKKVIRRNLSSVYVSCLYFLSKPQNNLQLLFVETVFMSTFILNSIVRIEVAFSSSEAVLLFVSTKNRDLWEGPTPEVRDSRTSRHSVHAHSQNWQSDWLRVRNEFSAHAPKIRPPQMNTLKGVSTRSNRRTEEIVTWTNEYIKSMSELPKRLMKLIAGFNKCHGICGNNYEVSSVTNLLTFLCN